MPLDSGHCDTVRNGKDALYLHPTVLSGVMQEDHIPELQQLLSSAATFRVLGIDLHMECFELTDEESRQRLEEQTERIDNTILEACRTRNGETCSAQVQLPRASGRQFAIRRLTDLERSGPYIAEGYVGERIEQLIADGRLITAQTRYGQGLRTATEAELEMAENADPMQMHFLRGETMIYATGDLHGNSLRFQPQYFPEQSEMTKDDYMIVCGDFGCVWNGDKSDDPQLDRLEALPFTVLFVDGNHEKLRCAERTSVGTMARRKGE